MNEGSRVLKMIVGERVILESWGISFWGVLLYIWENYWRDRAAGLIIRGGPWGELFHWSV